MNSPNNIDIVKYNKRAKFFTSYSNYLDNKYGSDLGYNHLANVMTYVLEYFGGYDEYDKIVKYSEKIHHENIWKALSKLHNIYPNFFPKFKKVTTCFFESCMTIDFNHNDDKTNYYTLTYNNNKMWCLEDTNKVFVDNKSIKIIIECMSLLF